MNKKVVKKLTAENGRSFGVFRVIFQAVQSDFHLVSFVPVRKSGFLMFKNKRVLC